MNRLSISRAWDETRAALRRDGRLFTSIALAMIALPTVFTTVVMPAGLSETTAASSDVLIILASLIALAGQLALIRLALPPAISVGSGIMHGFRRLPWYLLAVVLVCGALLLAAIPFGAVLALLGIPVDPAAKQYTPPVLAASLLYFALILFVASRVILAAPVASAEANGPITILRRSWALSSGNGWRLLGFLLLFFIGALVLMIAVQSVATLLVSVALGPLQPMSPSALVVGLVQALTNAAISTLFAVMLARIYAQLSGRSDVQPASVPNSGT
jgi:hypothetical protein